MFRIFTCLFSTCRQCYIRFIRKVNEKKGAEGLEETRKAFDFMLSYVGGCYLVSIKYWSSLLLVMFEFFVHQVPCANYPWFLNFILFMFMSLFRYTLISIISKMWRFVCMYACLHVCINYHKDLFFFIDCLPRICLQIATFGIYAYICIYIYIHWLAQPIIFIYCLLRICLRYLVPMPMFVHRNPWRCTSYIEYFVLPFKFFITIKNWCSCPMETPIFHSSLSNSSIQQLIIYLCFFWFMVTYSLQIFTYQMIYAM